MLFEKKKVIKKGNEVIFDFSGYVNGIQFPGGTANDFSLVIGSGDFIDGFEEQMIGLKEGQKALIKVRFPIDYGEPSLNGKMAEFKVFIKKIK